MGKTTLPVYNMANQKTDSDDVPYISMKYISYISRKQIQKKRTKLHV